MEELSISSVFRKYCEKHNFDFGLKLKELQSLLHYPSQSEFEKRLKPLSFSVFKHEGMYANKRDYIVFARQLHFIYGIPYNEFGFSLEEIESEFSIDKIKNPKLYFPSHTVGSEIQILNLQTKEFTSLYLNYKNVIKNIDAIEENFTCYNYLERQNYVSNDNLSAYFQANRNIYLNIEHKLNANPHIKYIRFLSLPLNYQMPVDFFEQPKKIQDSILLTEIINLCPLFLFKHICRCLKKNYTTPLKSRSEFILCPIAISGHSWGIIDSGKCLLLEHQRFNKKGLHLPSTLFICRNANSTKEYRDLIALYQSDCADLEDKDENGNSRYPAIDFFNIRSALETLERSYEMEKESIVNSEARSTQYQNELFLENKLEELKEKIYYISRLYEAQDVEIRND